MTGRKSLTRQPLTDESNILAFNGEIYSFDCTEVSGDESDTRLLFDRLVSCHGNEDLILETIGKIRGPFAFVFVDKEREVIWFGRDILGRRSLCWYFNEDDGQFIICSIGNYYDGSNSWSEVPCNGVYCLKRTSQSVEPEVSCYEWNRTPSGKEAQSTSETQSNPGSKQLNFIRYIRNKRPICPITSSSPQGSLNCDLEHVLHQFCHILSNSIRRRISHYHGACVTCLSNNEDNIYCSHAKVGVLFSGGIDSTVIALLADDHIPKHEAIDLLNVSFMEESAPDRMTARVALEELQTLRPDRQWRLVLIDPSKEELTKWRSKRIKQLIFPLETVLDDSIGCSMWFASSGNVLTQGEDKSVAKILLNGLGSDEQLAGYSRHRRIFDQEGILGLERELAREVDNLHTRNLGRDDRLVSDHGKEIRHPFLDEDVVSFLNSLPVTLKCDLSQPRGIGEKKLLRLLAERLGLNKVSKFEKRAIQFGSRISKVVNVGHEKGDMKCARLFD